MLQMWLKLVRMINILEISIKEKLKEMIQTRSAHKDPDLKKANKIKMRMSQLKKVTEKEKSELEKRMLTEFYMREISMYF